MISPWLPDCTIVREYSANGNGWLGAKWYATDCAASFAFAALRLPRDDGPRRDDDLRAAVDGAGDARHVGHLLHLVGELPPRLPPQPPSPRRKESLICEQ